tara:strand:- start:1463 stop:2761 length:1299 start_codon:yes stop_codon:yes gene_type:complete
MTQVGNKNIDNASGKQVREDIEDTFKAVATNNFGARASGGTILPCEFFADDTSNKLLIRASTGGDQADPAHSNAASFHEVGLLDTDNLGLLPLSGGTMTDQFLADSGGDASAPAIAFGDSSNSANDDLDTGFYRVGSNSIGITNGGTQCFELSGSGMTIYGDTNSARRIFFREATQNGSQHIGLKAPNSINTNFELTLPSSITAGGFLQVDASGNLSFQTISTSAGGLTGNSLSSNIVSSSLTSVGTLASLTVAGTITGNGDIQANGNINGNGSTTLNNMNAGNFATLNAVNIVASGGFIGSLSTNRPPYFADGNLRFSGVLCRAFIAFNGQNMTTTHSANISLLQRIPNQVTGMYRITFAYPMNDVNGVTRNDYGVCCSIAGDVYNVQGSLAHSHPFVDARTSTTVQIRTHTAVNSGQLVNQSHVTVAVFT